MATMRLIILLLLGAWLFPATAYAQAEKRDLVAQGQYIFALAGGWADVFAVRSVDRVGKVDRVDKEGKVDKVLRVNR